MDLNSPKKILWLTSWYPNRLDKFTGDFIQRHAQAVSQFCKIEVIYIKKDDNISANTSSTIINRSGNLTEQIIYYNSCKINFKPLDRLISFLNYNKHYRKAVKQYLKENGKPDYVHVHVAMNAGVTALWIKKKWNIPYLVTEHWSGYYRQSIPSVFDYGFLFRFLNKRILKKAALFFPVTHHLGETVKKDFVDISYQVIPNVVNTALFNYKPSGSHKFRFIHISFMGYEKNPAGIFAAAQLLKERGYEFELLMLGNKNEKLSAMAMEFNLTPEYVIFKDAVLYIEVPAEIQKSSALLLFSRYENLPCVILEALCCGLPVISSNVGGIAEVVDKENGILVESENIEALANAMQKMMDDYHNYDREKIALDAFAKFNYKKVGRQIANFYK
jgi:glycosyltransferase involved in cell wall biosynthesis